MLQIQQARQIAEKEIESHWTIPNDSPIIIDKETIEKPYAWIFFYTSKHWFETGNLDYAIAGNAPLFVAKSNGNISRFGTGYSVDEMIDKYEEQNKIWSLIVTSEIYNNAKQLLVLKTVLELTQEKLLSLKTSKEFTVDKGAYKRLNKLRLGLTNKQVDAEVIATALDAYSYAQQEYCQ